jgi:hypothetical protein
MQEVTGTMRVDLDKVDRIAISVLRVIPKTKFQLASDSASYEASTPTIAAEHPKLNMQALNSHSQSLILNLSGIFDVFDTILVWTRFCVEPGGLRAAGADSVRLGAPPSSR